MLFPGHTFELEKITDRRMLPVLKEAFCRHIFESEVSLSLQRKELMHLLLIIKLKPSCKIDNFAVTNCGLDICPKSKFGEEGNISGNINEHKYF